MISFSQCSLAGFRTKSKGCQCVPTFLGASAFLYQFLFAYYIKWVGTTSIGWGMQLPWWMKLEEEWYIGMVDDQA